ncbi:type II toxin-antitoxin system VapB family antitoxin [Moraxella nasovis]|uniref:antitoxin n=1 Tax=Moraxella nasovis TaxID=2904121 RepID=UPI001F60366F|nr:type II toxin-antitoxin system VapB family antitoxin [Moraxella nasovis]UNU73367.1 type II toxin-antitoxin system VapB family antitoxin [Moraxella nasovis]
MITARLFYSGNSQAIRLPKEFRFDGDKVQLKKHGNQLIITPIIDDWGWLDDVSSFDDDMEQAVAMLKDDPISKRDFA